MCPGPGLGTGEVGEQAEPEAVLDGGGHHPEVGGDQSEVAAEGAAEGRQPEPAGQGQLGAVGHPRLADQPRTQGRRAIGRGGRRRRRAPTSTNRLAAERRGRQRSTTRVGAGHGQVQLAVVQQVEDLVVRPEPGHQCRAVGPEPGHDRPRRTRPTSPDADGVGGRSPAHRPGRPAPAPAGRGSRPPGRAARDPAGSAPPRGRPGEQGQADRRSREPSCWLAAGWDRPRRAAPGADRSGPVDGQEGAQPLGRCHSASLYHYFRLLLCQ